MLKTYTIMLLKVNSVYHLLHWSDYKTYLAESSKEEEKCHFYGH
ncbi:UNVERIFIED_ORG: hypothetical protein ABIC97_000595 [Peribacillus simplex]